MSEKHTSRQTFLFIEHDIPELDRDAGSRSIFGMMSSLVNSGINVWFWPFNRAFRGRHTRYLERNKIRVFDERTDITLTEFLKKQASVINRVVVCRPDVAISVMGDITILSKAELVYYGVDIHFRRLRMQGTILNDRVSLLDSEQMEMKERRIWRFFDRNIYPSYDEARDVKSLDQTVEVHGIVPFCFSVDPGKKKIRQNSNILFVAGFQHPPNIDAANFLAKQIFPIVKNKIPDAKLILAGSHPTKEVLSLRGENICVTGAVSTKELDRLYDKSRAAIVPLRIGAGVKGKVIEALAHGLPLVTTEIGTQGIANLNGIVPVSNNPTILAKNLINLLTDDKLWSNQSRKQIKFAEKFYSDTAMKKSVLKAFNLKG